MERGCLCTGTSGEMTDQPSGPWACHVLPRVWKHRFFSHGRLKKESEEKGNEDLQNLYKNPIRKERPSQLYITPSRKNVPQLYNFIVAFYSRTIPTPETQIRGRGFEPSDIKKKR